MSTLLSVDPAITCTGWAKFIRDGSNVWELTDCGISRTTADKSTAHRVAVIVFDIATTPHRVTEVALEMPQIYAGSKLKGDPNDLLPLAMIAGGLACELSGVPHTYYKPRDWKGQVPKDAMIKRIEKRLTPDELSVINEYGGPAGLKHNMMDAVGIGLHHTGRL